MDRYMHNYRQWLAAGFDTWDALFYGLNGCCPPAHDIDWAVEW